MPQLNSGDHWPTLLAEVLTAPNLTEFYKAHREQFSPATDDRPFFNQVLRWEGLRVGNFYRIFATGTRGGIPLAEVMLIVMLVQTSAIAFAFILFPLRRLAHHGLQIGRPWTFLIYFGGLGVGFIMIEIVFIQRFLLFLGEPVYTFCSCTVGSARIYRNRFVGCRPF